MKAFILAGLFLFCMSFQAVAENVYVTDTVKIMFRTGPGIDHKILRAISSDELLTVLETNGQWAKVKRSNGQEGWVLAQWLSPELPKNVRLRILKKKYDQLLTKYSQLTEQNNESALENKELKSSLAIAKKNERDNRIAYENLKKASENYLSLKEDYTAVKSKLEKLTSETDTLNDQLTQKNTVWFLSGAGVLFLGIVLGFNSRRQRRGL